MTSIPQKPKSGDSLASRHPHLIQEWDSGTNPYTPEDYSHSSHYYAAWVCKEGHKWESPIYSRARGSGCHYCSGYKTLQGLNDLATTHRHLIPEWSSQNTKQIHEVSASSKYIASWICPVDGRHVWTTRVECRTRVRKQNCAVCVGKQIINGINDLASTHPHLVSEWDYGQNSLTPEQVTAGSSKLAAWVCSINSDHKWSAPISSRGSMGTSCPKCHIQSKVEDQLREALAQAGLYVIGTGPQTLDVVSKTSNRRLTADILLEGRTVIEYDGSYWHRSKQEIDTSKTRNLLEHGYKVIRIRENDLGPLPISHTNLFQLDYQYQKRRKVQDFSQLTHNILSTLDTLP